MKSKERKPEVIWKRKDGLARIVLFQENDRPDRYWLEVETLTYDVMGGKSWRLTHPEEANLEIKALALHLLGHALPKEVGISGKILV